MLPARRPSLMLPFELRSMLPAGSLAVTPVNAVEVGEGCSCDEDRDGTLSNDCLFVGCPGAAKVDEEACPSACKLGAVLTKLPPSSGRADNVLVGGVGARASEPAAGFSGWRG